MIKLMFAFSLAFISMLSANSYSARTDCPSATVGQIQIEGQKILYRQAGAPWRTLGYLNNDDGTRERYSSLLAALASDKTVIVGYPINGYDCTKTNYSTSAYIVRINQ